MHFIDMPSFMAKNELDNNNFKAGIAALSNSNKNIQANTKAKTDTNNLLKKCQSNRDSIAKKYEKDEKRHKALKRYGEALAVAGKLLDIIPENFDNLSVDQLEGKLQEFIKTKQKNDFQLMFDFYQKLFSNTLQNIVTVEKDFQAGTISEKGAIKALKDIRADLDRQFSMTIVPFELRKTYSEIISLIESHQASFSANPSKIKGTANLIHDDKLNPEHEYWFDQLELQTQNILNGVNSLAADISGFNPSVDLSKLQTSIKDADALIQTENFDADKLSSSTSAIVSETAALTDKQVEINHDAKNISNQIESLSSTCKDTAEKSMFEISKVTFEQTGARAEKAEDIAGEVVELAETTDAQPDVALGVLDTLSTQLEDANYALTNRQEIVGDPNADRAAYDPSKVNQAQDKIAEAKDAVLIKQEEKEQVLTVTHDDETQGNK